MNQDERDQAERDGDGEVPSEQAAPRPEAERRPPESDQGPVARRSGAAFGMSKVVESYLRLVEAREATPEWLEAQQLAKKHEDRRALVVSMRERGVPGKDVERIADDLLGGEPLLDTKAVAAAREWRKSDRKILILGGGRGVGKTVAAGWLVAQDSPDPHWRYGGRWPGELAPRFLDVFHLQRLSRYRAADLEPYERCSLLALDDVGMEQADEKGAFTSLLDGVLNTRYADGLRTVITTNVPAVRRANDPQGRDGFRERYGERLWDRIRETCRYIEIPDGSLRGRR